MENINCIFCNCESNEILIEENGYSGRKCPNCGLIYVSPRPTFDDIIDLYGHDTANIPATSHIKASFTKTLYARHNLEIIRKYINKGKILEIGSGAGYFLREARKQGFDVFGIELNKIQADFINENLNIPCEQSALSDNTFAGEKFDIIYHCDVISHFYDPIAEFEKARIKLNENGYMIFETGNLGDVNTTFLKYITKFQYPDHLFFFSEKNLRTLLEMTGFKLIKIYRFSIVPFLLFNKALNNFRNYIKPDKKPDNARELNINQSSTEKYEIFKQFILNSYHYVIYLIRYKLGLIMPKKGRPQTIILIAKKE